ncbi:hypothetical protein [Desulfogranum japonicum]|uniref:hypothetical protein n=1 Tax=Desulfogranum japonicum TaxID=231447 RepID=UPI00040C38C2|nr:hypothetical protein [Desulfogranum japonicum]
MNTLPEFIASLSRPESYPHPVEHVQLIQTHISYVLVAGDFVYKFKKPVDFGFLDFSTLEKRKACCERELLLNKRLCPDIYLNLVGVQKQATTYSLIEGDSDIEYGIQMRRMPENMMMGNVIARKELDRTHIDRIVEVLAPFYRGAESNEEIDSFGTAQSVGVNVLENFDQTASFVDQGALDGKQFQDIKAYAQAVLLDEKLFEDRIKAGRIRDCHGDLYSANICLADKVYIYDCIEFNDRFRYNDVTCDIAFLAMDLDYHGLEDLSNYCIDRFVAHTEDPGVYDLLDFYKCYRAYVRGKIGLFTAADPQVTEEVRQSSLESASRYFDLAHRYTKK